MTFDAALSRLATPAPESISGIHLRTAIDRPKTEVRVDLRFRLHRFATHLREHTIQIEKALDDLCLRPGDAPRAIRRLPVAPRDA